uniref:Uncharacterized protein n=1 Tax=Rhizophora mucronata TaxID=61149 RepID=A0A2P2PES6_RHIMU
MSRFSLFSDHNTISSIFHHFCNHSTIGNPS